MWLELLRSELGKRKACVTYLLHKIRKEMLEENLVLAGSSGLVIYDQDGTRGKLLVSFFVALCRGLQTFCPLKLTSQGFGLVFFKKHFFPLSPPVATVFWSKIHSSQTLRPVPALCWGSLPLRCFWKKIVNSYSQYSENFYGIIH